MDVSEFRQNLVSGEWVLFSTARSHRPHSEHAERHTAQSRDECIFEDLERSGQDIVWKYPDTADWTVAVIKNKFPAVRRESPEIATQSGPFQVRPARGEHEVFVFRDHDKQLHTLTPKEMLPVVAAYKRRKRELTAQDNGIAYVLAFHNFGASAGASIWHPHSQIIATPILPPVVSRSLYGAREFYRKHGKCVYDVMMVWEKEQAVRIVYENDFFLAYCPFASRRQGEIRLYPKNGQSHFAEMPDEYDKYFADALSVTLRKMAKALGEPSYNFYIHTAPAEDTLGDTHEFYTWHVEIAPKLKIDAGFELGTGIEVNAVDPDDYARLLRDAIV